MAFVCVPNLLHRIIVCPFRIPRHTDNFFITTIRAIVGVKRWLALRWARVALWAFSRKPKRPSRARAAIMARAADRHLWANAQSTIKTSSWRFERRMQENHSFVDVHLPPRSIYVMSGDCRTDWKHAVHVNSEKNRNAVVSSKTNSAFWDCTMRRTITLLSTKVFSDEVLARLLRAATTTTNNNNSSAAIRASRHSSRSNTNGVLKAIMAAT
jgi:hypothetical protein